VSADEPALVLAFGTGEQDGEWLLGLA